MSTVTIDEFQETPLTKYADADRFRHSVLDVCNIIHTTITGSGDGISDAELGVLADWLVWRITDGWRPTSSSMPLHWRAYDNAVRMLGRGAVMIAMGR